MSVDSEFSTTINEPNLDALFLQARSHFSWQEKSIPEDTIDKLYSAVRMGPTSGNACPARFIFIETPEAKAKLLPCLSSGNREKTSSAPLTVIVAYDPKFYELLPDLFPHNDARSWFTSSPDLAYETALRNSSLQGAYLIMAARILGLDAGPMSGFNSDAIKKAFMSSEGWEPNFIVNFGYGQKKALFARLPRLDFETACKRV